jgi:SAM-dependent methyltransferase
MHPNCYTELDKFIKILPTGVNVLDYRNTINSNESLSVCDVGSYNINGTFRNSFPLNYSYTGVDIAAGDNVDIVLSDPHRWKELDGKQFDVVVSANTIEHVKDLYSWFREFAKIIKVGGYFHINSPVVHHIHRYPIDCWRVLPDGMEFLIKEVAELELIDCYCSENDLITIGRKVK